MAFVDEVRPETIEALDGVIAHLKQDYQRLWLYVGENRVGKSTFAQHIADYVTAALESKLWLCFFYSSYPDEQNAIEDIRRDLGLTKTNIYPASVEYAQVTGGMYDNIDVDEAVRVVYKLNAMSGEAVDFTINFDLYGKRRFFYHMLMPEFDFSKGFREGRTHMLIQIPKRGLAYFYKPYRINLRKVIPSRPTWSDNFPQLDKERDEIYNQVKEVMLNMSKSLNRKITLNEWAKNTVVRFKIVRPDLTNKDIAKGMGLGVNTVQRYIAEYKENPNRFTNLSDLHTKTPNTPAFTLSKKKPEETETLASGDDGYRDLL